MEWIRHVAKRDQGRTVEKIFESTSEGSRRRGRRKFGWVEDVGRFTGHGRLRRADIRQSKGESGRP